MEQIDDKKARLMVKEVFKLIEKAQSITDLMKIKDCVPLEDKFFMDTETYPQLDFSLSEKEIDELIQKGLIRKDLTFNPDLSGNIHDPLTKLLYALAWKQGDLKKTKHIVQGVKEAEIENEKKKKGLVFYQFGKFLTKKPGQPIIDQHVLRAFKIYANKDEDDITRIRTENTVSQKDLFLITSYKEWLVSDKISVSLRKEKNYTYHIDQILFAAGKKIKKKKEKSPMRQLLS